MKKYTLIILLFAFVGTRSQAQVTNASAVQTAAKMVKFFPNPATTFINFEFQKLQEKSYSLQLYNFLGKKILDLAELTPRTQVNLTNYTRGVYIFQLKDKTGKVVESGKFQIEK
jgi:outer membrane biogenesis lipoprotein LolB